jgi:cytochrome c oxidase cbb3-type subunit 1
MRFLGGVLVVTGFVLMAYNMFKTISAKDGSLKPVEAV